MPSFSILNTAYQGMSAARAGIDVTGQNVANVNTEGYTRQRVEQSANPPIGEMGLGRVAPGKSGQGVSVDGIARLGNQFLEARVRQTGASAGYTSVRAAAYQAVEDIHGEPSDTGISSLLESFWGSWEDVANSPGEEAQAYVVLEEAGALADRIAAGRAAVESEWDYARATASHLVSEVNDLATRIASLNKQIKISDAEGASVNELIDQRNQLTEKVAQLAGGKAHENADGTVSVTIGGNFLVDGARTNEVTLAGATTLNEGEGNPVRLEWAHRAGAAANLDGGELAGQISAMAPAGSGGIFAAAAAGYDELATELASQLNALHGSALTTDGTPGGDFFTFAPGTSSAAGLTVAITDPSGLAAAAPGQGALDGSVADQIASLGLADNGPNAVWQSFVTTTATRASSANYDADLASAASTAANTELLSSAAVSLDEETVNLMQYQHAYQGAARVMTVVDEMLDVLINRTGRVGL